MPRTFNVLVLGQSGSGKSTFIRHLQRAYDTESYEEEGILCQLEIQRIIVRSTSIILDALSCTGRPDIAKALRHRLSILMELIQYQLTPESNPVLPEEEAPPPPPPLGFAANLKEAILNPAAALSRWTSDGLRDDNTRDERRGYDYMMKEVQLTLYTMQSDLIRLWQDDNVRDMMEKKEIHLEKDAEILLNDLERVASLEYVPTEAEILRWRYKAIGTAERRLMIGDTSKTREWSIIELGGSRDQRYTWAPFLTGDVDVMIFVVSLADFNENLPENKSTNRLEDSIELWKGLWANQDLRFVGKILLLNKYDVLEEKLKSGIKFPYKFPIVFKEGETKTSFAVACYIKRFTRIVHQENKKANKRNKLSLRSILATTMVPTLKGGTDPTQLNIAGVAEDMVKAVDFKTISQMGI